MSDTTASLRRKISSVTVAAGRFRMERQQPLLERHARPDRSEESVPP